MASVREPDRTAAEPLADRREDGAVDLVEAAVVDAEQRQAVVRGGDRSIVPSPRTSAKSRTRRSSRLAMRGVPRDRRAISHAASASMATPRMPAARRDDRLELVVGVVVEPGDEAEAVAQRPGDQPGAGRGADERERRQVEPDRRRRRTLADDDVELEVLHRRVEDLLDGARQAVDLVDEQHVAVVELGEDGRQVAGPLERRTGGDVQVHAHLDGDDAGQGGLAEPGRPGEQQVVGRPDRASAPPRGRC